MGQRTEDADFAQEALTADGACEVGIENLYRDLALMQEVGGTADHGHAPAPDLAGHIIAAGKATTQRRHKVQLHDSARFGDREQRDSRPGIVLPDPLPGKRTRA